jgi:hypothetical protein
MEKHKPPFAITFFRMRGIAPSAISQKLQHTLGSTAYSENWVEN